MGKEFDITPVNVPKVDTKYRRIVTPVPHPDSVATLETLHRVEPISMRGQPPIVWDRAENCQVYDKYGNMWLDWSSGVLVTNAGHGMPEVRRAIVDQVGTGLLHNYVFPSEERAQLVEFLADLAPEGLDKVFLLTTGSESTEKRLKNSRERMALQPEEKRKSALWDLNADFTDAQWAPSKSAECPGKKDWIGNEGPRHRTGTLSRRILDRKRGFRFFLLYNQRQRTKCRRRMAASCSKHIRVWDPISRP